VELFTADRLTDLRSLQPANRNEKQIRKPAAEKNASQEIKRAITSTGVEVGTTPTTSKTIATT